MNILHVRASAAAVGFEEAAAISNMEMTISVGSRAKGEVPSLFPIIIVSVVGGWE